VIPLTSDSDLSYLRCVISSIAELGESHAQTRPYPVLRIYREEPLNDTD
jgi:hypothetical protein